MDARGVTTAALGICVLLRTAPARAADCPSKLWSAAPVSNLSSESRRAFLREGLAKGRARTGAWANAWGGAWAALTVFQIGIVATDDAPRRRDDVLFAAATPLGLVPTWIFPPEILSDEASETLSKIDFSCRDLERVEGLLMLSGEDDLNATGWVSHVSNAAVNVTLGLIVGQGFGHWKTGGWNLLAGLALGEAQILTHPRAAIGLRTRYVNGDLSAPPAASLWNRTHWAVSPSGDGAFLSASLSWP